jgi:hypothetical protein
MKLWILLLAACLAHGQTTRFKKAQEPKEGAFTMLLPEGWTMSGGIIRVNPLTAGGPLNSIAAKVDFTVSSADGRTLMRWYPEMNWMDVRGQPAAAAFPNGSNYNGATVWPKLNAVGYLQQGVFRRSHPRAVNVRVKTTSPLPGVAQSYRQVVAQMGLPPIFQFDAALMIVEFQENGAAQEEMLYTAIQDWGQAGAGLWTNKDTFSIRTPAGDLERQGRLVSVMLNSVRLNPRWVEGEIRGQMQRNEIAIRTQQEIARLDREITEHRRRTNAEINNQMYHNLMRTEEYVNPLTKETEVGSNEWNYRWVNEQGEAIYSDDSNFDPARAGLRGFVRSPVRKRFPGK